MEACDDGCGGPYATELAAARLLIPGLLWVLKEANRQLGGAGG